MAFKKKDLPLSLLQVLDKYRKLDSQVCKVVDSDDSLLLIEDIEPDSPFFFEVKGFTIDKEKLILHVIHKPRSTSDIKPYESRISANMLDGRFNTWEAILKAYNSIKNFDDPILKKYQEEFEQEIEVLDDDAEYNSYGLNTQLWIDEYLSDCQRRLQAAKNPENEKEVESLEEDIKDLKANQTKLPKKKVVQALAKIWARTRKIGLSLLKDVYNTAKNEIIKRLVTGQIDDLIQ